MSIGIRQMKVVTTAFPVTNVTLQSIASLITPIGANKSAKIRYVVPISVGAAGGVRVQVAVPAGGTAFLAAIYLANTVAPSVTNALQVASAAFTNALANAGNHYLVIEATVINGATAGNIDLQIAQNTNDATPVTVLVGASADITKL